MNDLRPVVFIVDDDEATREMLRCLIESVALDVQTFSSAHAFLKAYQPNTPGCLLLDVRMPEMSGLDLQDRMLQQKITLPVILLTCFGDVQMAVKAMKKGAMDFIEKPFNEQFLLDRVHEAIKRHKTILDEDVSRAEILARMSRLSNREADVMKMVVDGKSNKTIAAELGLSPKTVEVHRARMMEKMAADSLAELVRLNLMTTNHLFEANGTPTPQFAVA